MHLKINTELNLKNLKKIIIKQLMSKKLRSKLNIIFRDIAKIIHHYWHSAI
jgi:hypothetical protein